MNGVFDRIPDKIHATPVIKQTEHITEFSSIPVSLSRPETVMTMYMEERKVVIPPNISRFIVVPFSFS